MLKWCVKRMLETYSLLNIFICKDVYVLYFKSWQLLQSDIWRLQALLFLFKGCKTTTHVSVFIWLLPPSFHTSPWPSPELNSACRGTSDKTSWINLFDIYQTDINIPWCCKRISRDIILNWLFRQLLFYFCSHQMMQRFLSLTSEDYYTKILYYSLRVLAKYTQFGFCIHF